MGLIDLLKGRSQQEQIDRKKQQLEIEKLEADIREQKLRGQPKNGKKKFLDGWNPDSKHLDNILGFGGNTK